jgi:ribonuclease HII
MIIVGVDEVGRGCWAGPLVAGAVILREPIAGLKDSKLLSKKQREKLAIIIHEQAIAVGLGWVDPATIDEHGLTMAVSRAMHEAVAQITHAYDQVIVDGSYNFLKDNPKAVALVKADQSVTAVSAASIIAKVARDQYMANQAAEYPDYGFEQHVGYGTAMHLEKLKLYGISDLHRRSFKPISALLQ